MYTKERGRDRETRYNTKVEVGPQRRTVLGEDKKENLSYGTKYMKADKGDKQRKTNDCRSLKRQNKRGETRIVENITRQKEREKGNIYTGVKSSRERGITIIE